MELILTLRPCPAPCSSVDVLPGARTTYGNSAFDIEVGEEEAAEPEASSSAAGAKGRKGRGAQPAGRGGARPAGQQEGSDTKPAGQRTGRRDSNAGGAPKPPVVPPAEPAQSAAQMTLVTEHIWMLFI